MKQLQHIFLIILLASLIACAPKTTIKSDNNQVNQGVVDAQVSQAIDLYNAKDFGSAAPLLEALISRPAPQSWEWQLKAADAYLQMGHLAKTRELIAPLTNKQMNPNLLELMRLVNASLLLQSFNPEEALLVLYQTPDANVHETLKHRYYQLLAEAS